MKDNLTKQRQPKNVDVLKNKEGLKMKTTKIMKILDMNI